MSSLFGTSAPYKAYTNQVQKSFLTSQAFNTKLLTYTTSVNPTTFQTQGQLVANAGATAANCPTNRVLHATGRVLVPGVNPGVNSPLIGVYDPITGLNGFIDATDPAFAVYNTNMPTNYDLGISSVIATLGGQGANARIGLDSGTLTPATENGGVNAGNASIGEFAFSTITGRASTISVSSTQVLPTSRIFLTQSGTSTTAISFSTCLGGVPPIPTVSSVTTGSFQVIMPSAFFANDIRRFSWVVM